MRRRSRFWPLACCAAAALWPAPGRAQEAAVHDATGCLAAGAVGDGDGVELFVTRDTRGYSVRILTTDGRERTLRARSCAQARSAARVVVTLARAAQDASESLEADTPPPVAPPAPHLLAPISAPTRSADPQHRSPPLRPAQSAGPERKALRWHLTASGGVAVGPGLMAEASLGAGLTFRAVRVDLALAMRAPDAEPLRAVAAATTEVRTWLGRARVCRVLGLRARIELGACAVLELGALTAAAYGPGVMSQAPRTTLWAASAAGMTASVSLGRSLALLAELDVGVAWTRPRLVVEGAGTVRTSPGYMLGARAGLELGL